MKIILIDKFKGLVKIKSNLVKCCLCVNVLTYRRGEEKEHFTP